MAWAAQPAVRATAKMASPAPSVMPATRASTATAKSMFGPGRPRPLTSARTASAPPGAAPAPPARAGAPARDPPRQGAPPRVTGPVDEVPEARDPFAPAQQVADDGGHPGRRARRGPQVLPAQGGAAGR